MVAANALPLPDEQGPAVRGDDVDAASGLPRGRGVEQGARRAEGRAARLPAARPPPGASLDRGRRARGRPARPARVPAAAVQTLIAHPSAEGSDEHLGAAGAPAVHVGDQRPVRLEAAPALHERGLDHRPEPPVALEGQDEEVAEAVPPQRSSTSGPGRPGRHRRARSPGRPSPARARCRLRREALRDVDAFRLLLPCSTRGGRPGTKEARAHRASSGRTEPRYLVGPR